MELADHPHVSIVLYYHSANGLSWNMLNSLDCTGDFFWLAAMVSTYVLDWIDLGIGTTDLMDWAGLVKFPGSEPVTPQKKNITIL